MQGKIVKSWVITGATNQKYSITQDYIQYVNRMAQTSSGTRRHKPGIMKCHLHRQLSQLL